MKVWHLRALLLRRQSHQGALPTDAPGEVLATALVQTDGGTDNILFIHDGAPPHWGISVRNWLNDKMLQRWMGRGSSLNMPWPPRSTDRTPCDFFLWGFVKSKVYKSRPSSVPELKERIITTFQEVTTDLCQQTVLAYRERLHQLTENGGRHAEVH